jgi:aspartate/methionine/tyrosine aminotransferase
MPLSESAVAILQQSPGEAEPVTTASPEVRAAVESALNRGETHYTDRPGILPLREKIAALLQRRFGLALNAKADVIVSCGVAEARFVAIQQLLKPGETLSAPVHSERIAGAELLRRAELTPTITPDVRAIYLTSSTAESALRAYLSQLPADVAILYEADDPAGSFHPAQVPGFEHSTLTLGALGADSWRIGYLASPAILSPALRDFKQSLTICSTNLSQWAVLAELQSAGEGA